MDVLKIMTDAVRGVTGEFSKKETSDAIRNALIEANGGSTTLNKKKFYRGAELFALVEELIPVVVDEGLKADNPLFALVDYRNVADGDEASFTVEAGSQIVVADAAAGIRGVRRQRIDNAQTITVPTTLKMVRVYEELGRLLAGRIDFDKFVAGIADAFTREILAEAYKAIAGITANTAGLDSTYVTGGSYNEDSLIALIQHVEAASGMDARILGTKAALRKIKTATVSHEAESDMYNLGYYGKFNGTDMICLRQAHVPGTDTFVLDDSKVYIVAGNDKPVKVVNEGEGLLIERDATDNNDLTQEYIYGQGIGVGVVVGQKLGVYTLS